MTAKLSLSGLNNYTPQSTQLGEQWHKNFLESLAWNKNFLDASFQQHLGHLDFQTLVYQTFPVGLLEKVDACK